MLISLLRRYLAPYKVFLGLVVLFQLIGTLANLYLPSLNAKIIDDGVAKADIDYIWRTGGVMLVISLLQVLCTITAVYFGARTAMAYGRDVRSAIFDRVLTFSAREVNHFGAPSLITRNTNDVQQVQMLVLMSCTMLVAAPITMVGGVIMALRENAGLAWLIVVAVPVLAISVGAVVIRLGPLFRKMQERIDNVNRVLREQITGIRVVRAFVREPYETDRFAGANDDLTQIALKVGRLFALMFPIVMLIMNLSSAAVIWFGGHRIDAGNMQIGEMTAFLTYLIQILMSVMMATFLLMIAPRAAVSAERISDVLNTESSVVLPTNPVTSTPERGVVRFNNTEFTYPGADSP
ncbi:MAG TPA: ABC transporter permease, partial [Microlunatus sp.]